MLGMNITKLPEGDWLEWCYIKGGNELVKFQCVSVIRDSWHDELPTHFTVNVFQENPKPIFIAKTIKLLCIVLAVKLLDISFSHYAELLAWLDVGPHFTHPCQPKLKLSMQRSHLDQSLKRSAIVHEAIVFFNILTFNARPWDPDGFTDSTEGPLK